MTVIFLHILIKFYWCSGTENIKAECICPSVCLLRMWPNFRLPFISLMALKGVENVINRKSFSYSFKKEAEFLLEMWLKNPKTILSMEIWSEAMNKMLERELGFRKVTKATVLHNTRVGDGDGWNPVWSWERREYPWLWTCFSTEHQVMSCCWYIFFLFQVVKNGALRHVSFPFSYCALFCSN